MDQQKPEQLNNGSASFDLESILREFSRQQPQTAPPPQMPPEPAPAPEQPRIRPVTPPNLQEQFRSSARALGAARIRLFLFGLVTLFALLLFVNSLPAAPPVFLSEGSMGLIAAGVTLAALLLAYEVALHALAELMRIRIGIYALGTLAALLSIYDALRYGSFLWVLACVQLFSLQRSLVSAHSARASTLHRLVGMTRPDGVFRTKKLPDGTSALRTDKGNPVDFLLNLDRTDGPKRLGTPLATALALSSPLLAYLLAPRAQAGFVRAWLSLLLGALPLCAALSYTRPFGALCRRLGKNAALCGWHATRLFSGKYTVVLRDEDLFAAGSVVPNGMKLYSPLTASRVIAYTLAALEAAGSPLAEVFDKLLQAQSGKRCTAAAYRCYDDGGIEADVAGETVLVGSISFMQSIGVHMPKGARLRQAVYVSIGGELAGIFALKYNMSASVISGLRELLSKPRLDIVLMTRDFLITPELLAAKLNTPTRQMRFPPYGRRLRQPAWEKVGNIGQGALVARGDFGAFASSVAAAKTLRTAASVNLFLTLLAGVLGFLTCALMLFWGTVPTVLHLAVYHLLWALLAEFSCWLCLHL